MNNNHPNRGRQAALRASGIEAMRVAVDHAMPVRLTCGEAIAILAQLDRIPAMEIQLRKDAQA